MTANLFRVPMLLLYAVILIIVIGLGLQIGSSAADLRPQVSDAEAVSVAASQPVINVPTLRGPEWQRVPLTQPYSSSSYMKDGVTSNTVLDTSGIHIPDNVYCNEIAKITGSPCIWKSNYTKYNDGSETIDVELSSGDEVLARGNAMKVDLAEIVEIPRGVYPSAHGWLDYIEVAKWLERSGFGRLTWLAIDTMLRQQFGNGGPVVRIFVDAAGWANHLLADTPNVTRYGTKLYVYLIGG